jgi:hypothetical protein
MSGQPYKKPKDIQDAKDRYMENLRHRATLDDENLQANKIYQETGALPPRSTMKDNRTTAEILLDVERLKVGIVAAFKGVATPDMITQVLTRVKNSPLNADGSFMVWIAQNITELVSNLKKKYKFGIVGNENDAEQLFLFLQSTYSATREMSSSVRGAFDRPAGQDRNGLQPGDFTSLKKQYDDIYMRLVTAIPGISRDLTSVKNQFDALATVIIPPTRYDAVRTKFQAISLNRSATVQNDINNAGFKDWINYSDNLPAPAMLRTLLSQLEKSVSNTDGRLSSQILSNISSIIPSVNKSNEMYALTNAILGAVIPPTVRPAAPSGGPADTTGAVITGNGMTGSGIGKRRPGRPKGSGVIKPISERIDKTKGIKQGHTHVPFGKYILNKNKLDGDIVLMKYMKGEGIKGHPQTKVSNRLGSVLRTIVGGGVPNFEDLNKLDDDEKEYLHKVSSKAGILDKLSIPVPSKDKREKDVHQFEVMKGQILAGNDSPEIIKGFKLLLLRLSRNGTIPKREGVEIMEDLIALGY